MFHSGLSSRCRVCFLVLIMTVWCNAAGATAKSQDDQGESPTHPEVCRLFDSVLLNAEAWQQGDVLVRIRHSFDTVGGNREIDLHGVALSGETLIRLTFDHQAGRYLVLSKAREESLNLGKFDSGQKPDQSREVLSGRCFQRGDDTYNERVFPAPMRQMPVRLLGSSLEQALVRLQVPELRTIALDGQSTPGRQGRMVENLKQLAAGLNFKSHEALAEGESQLVYSVDLGLPSEQPEVGPCRQETIYTFDDVSLQLVHVKSDVISTVPVDGKFRHNLSEVRTRWREFDGVFVPCSVSSSQSQQLVVDKTPHEGRLITEYELHWFSLNKPLDEAQFNGKCLTSIDEFLRLVDPEKANATSLLTPLPESTKSPGEPSR